MSNFLGMSEKDLMRQTLTIVESMNNEIKALKEHILDMKVTMREIKASTVRKYEKKD
jgi:hypothetical protein